jgi:phytoene dehydrogenase-like protein
MANKKFVQCQTCGTVFPADYFEQWGRRYGHGLGRLPVCEALSSNYNVMPIYPTQPPQPEKSMHPVGICGGTVIMAQLPEDTPTAIISTDDPYMIKRGELMQKIQRKKSPVLEAHLKNIEKARASA